MLSFIILIVTVSINTILALLISYKKKRDFDLSIGVFITGIAALIAWSVANYFADNSSGQDALFWTRFAFPTSLLMVWSIAWFSFSFPDKLWNYGYLNATFFVATVAASAISMTDLSIVSVEVEPGIGISDVALGPLYPLIISVYLILIITIISNLIAKYRHFTGTKKMQVGYVILGWSIFIAGAMTTSLILPYITGNADWSKFGPLLSVIMVASTSYAIIRYRFLEIRLIIQQGLAYAVLIAIIGVIYLLIARLGGLFFTEAAGLQYSLSGYLTALIGIFGMPAVKKAFDRYTDRIFFRDKYDFSDAVRSLSQVLNENIELERLREEIISKIKDLMKLEYASIVLSEEIERSAEFRRIKNDLWPLARNGDLVFFSSKLDRALENESGGPMSDSIRKMKKYAERKGIRVFVILRIGDELIGLLCIGQKLSKGIFDSNDLNLLRNLGYQMAVAFEKARLYKGIKDYSANLEKKVRERTKRISMLQDEQKQTILDIAHGLQTPITIIRGELDILKIRHKKNQGLVAFSKSIDRISRLISDLLLLAKLEVSQEKLEMKKMDLSGHLLDLSEYFEVVMRNKRINFVSDIEKGLGIIGDEHKIDEMINSFISNSMKYIGKGKSIRLSLNKDGEKAVITIKDDGIGIPKDEIPKLTRRFYRAKNNTDKGSGLGLAICQKIIDIHGGKLAVKSNVGEGTEMVVSFKLAS